MVTESPLSRELNGSWALLCQRGLHLEKGGVRDLTRAIRTSSRSTSTNEAKSNRRYGQSSSSPGRSSTSQSMRRLSVYGQAKSSDEPVFPMLEPTLPRPHG